MTIAQSISTYLMTGMHHATPEGQAAIQEIVDREVDRLTVDNAAYKTLFDSNPTALYSRVAALEEVAIVRETQFRARQEEVDQLRLAIIAVREGLRQVVELANVNDATREMLVQMGNHLNNALKP